MSAAALAALAVAVVLGRPGSTPWLPGCPLHALTGWYCPGCGSTRMLYFLLHGQVGQAFRQNGLALLLLPGVLYGLARQLAPAARLPWPRLHARWSTALFAVVIAFTALRNVPAAPFCALAPGGVCRVAFGGR